MLRLMFFFNDTATTEIYTLSLHDALPISGTGWPELEGLDASGARVLGSQLAEISGRIHQVIWGEFTAFRDCQSETPWVRRSEEHTSELQSRQYLVCRLLLEKKNRAQLWLR